MNYPDDWEERDGGLGISPSRYDEEEQPDHCQDCGAELTKGGGSMGYMAECPNCGVVYSW